MDKPDLNYACCIYEQQVLQTGYGKNENVQHNTECLLVYMWAWGTGNENSEKQISVILINIKAIQLFWIEGCKWCKHKHKQFFIHSHGHTTHISMCTELSLAWCSNEANRERTSRTHHLLRGLHVFSAHQIPAEPIKNTVQIILFPHTWFYSTVGKNIYILTNV